MRRRTKDIYTALGFLASFAVLLLWGYASGDMQKLLAHHGSNAEQRALDHLFGSDGNFDPNADNVSNTAESSHDTLSWKLLSQAKLHSEMVGKLPVLHVEFGQNLSRLDGQNVTITGYMFPLQTAANQQHFLLSAYPPSCPYCLPAGPTELIDITDSQPMRFTYTPITVEGALHLLRTPEELQDGMVYRMSGAHLSSR